MNHRKQARNHPLADVGVGYGSALMALGVLTRAVRDDSPWGVVFALSFLLGVVPWTIKATRYAVQRHPDNSASNGGRPDRHQHEGQPGPFYPDCRVCNPRDVPYEGFQTVVAVDQAGSDSVVVAGVRAPDGTVTIQGITRKPPPMPTLKIPGDAGLLSLAEVEEALTGWSEKFKAAPPKVDALSYDGDPRLSPGFWVKEDGESESDYWRRLCGHDDTVPGHRHMLTCPDWEPGQI